ncbi:putative Ig domain-containing protein [Streptosporangium sp. NPDC048865]|uniref:putative Ig domain-containing protein n=1 Tax=Streptosporangium sp. NPDC048865 TaxID=3155766 RepID=UPI00342C8556
MRGKQGFPWMGIIVAGAVVCGVPATPGVALATPAPDPAPAPASIQAPDPVAAPAPPSVRPPDQAPAGGAGQPVAGDSSSLSAYPLLGHFGVAVDRPLRGRITLANPTGETVSFKVINPALLPAGITLDADGLLGGTSRVPGTWTVPVEACVPSGRCTGGTVSITITCRCARPLPPSPTLTGTPCSGVDVTTS